MVKHIRRHIRHLTRNVLPVISTDHHDRSASGGSRRKDGATHESLPGVHQELFRFAQAAGATCGQDDRPGGFRGHGNAISAASRGA